MTLMLRVAAGLAAVLAWTWPAAAEETPKHGGILTYVIPADSPPSFDGHREETYATIHSVAPFYSVLIRANPMDPSSPDMVCDLCTEMPKPTDGGKTYTFKIRSGVKFTDGTPLTSADIVASWNKIIFPPEGVRPQRAAARPVQQPVEPGGDEAAILQLVGRGLEQPGRVAHSHSSAPFIHS